MEEDDESDSSDASGKPANDSVTNDPVERLLADCLAALEDSGERGMEEVLDAQPEHAQQVRESVQALRSAGLVESPTIYDDDFPETLGDFRLLHRLGRGGMGVVYLAEQQSLGRQVALKLIRPEMMFFEGSRDRFRREVETVAGLQHPGIVAVHSVGDEGGVPYFAMEYVRGKSLEELLSATSKRDAAELTGRDLDPSGTGSGYLFSGTWEEACLRVMRQVCEALEFAHQRGILHRDIKPSNIMISEDGASRVLLLDFGLSSDRSSSEMTQSGSRLGSLRYMSSEQLRGSRSEMGAHTDVYGVGVTLYEMMVQAPAFEAPSDAEIVLAIQRGTLPLLRTRNTACSWEVETICATATDQEPRRRYATSADMARDLANALEHRPIEARRAGVVLRSKRWIERRPAMATAVGFVLLLLIGGPLTFAWQQHKASIVIAAERDRAVQAYDSAMEAVDRMLSRLGEEDLKLIPAMGLVRRKVFEDAVALLEKLVDAADGEAPGRERFELARAHQRIGALLRELGHAADAAVALSNARDLYLELRADPARVEVEADDLTEFIAAATVSFADCQRESGELDAALSTIVSLDEFLEEALVARPDSRMLRYYKTTNKQARAMILDAQGLRDESRDAYLESIAELEAQGTEGERDLLAMRAKKSIWGAYGLLLMESFSTEQGLHPDVLDLLERTAGMAAQIAEHESALPG
ncbi:MAG: serine/threonine protein kinase, partial [Planctomycetota bacterium]